MNGMESTKECTDSSSDVSGNRSQRSTERLGAVLDEYKTSLASMEKNLENIFQILGFSTGALAIIAVYFLQSGKGIGENTLFAWLLPVAPLVVFALIIVTTAYFMTYLWSTRIAARQINIHFDEVILARYEPVFPSASFFSLRRGDKKFLSIILVIVGLALAITLGAIGSGFCTVYGVNHAAGTAFLVVYGVVVLFELLAAHSALVELPRRYRVLFQHMEEFRKMPVVDEMRAALASTTSGRFSSILVSFIPSTTVVDVIKWLSSGAETDAEEGLGHGCQHMGGGTGSSGGADWLALCAVGGQTAGEELPARTLESSGT